MLSFNISFWNLIQFSYFVDTIERGDSGWKEAQKQGEHKLILWITLAKFHPETKTIIYSQLFRLRAYDCEISGSVKMYHIFTNLFDIKRSKGKEI